MSHIPFQTIDWTNIEKTEHAGETGTAWWQTVQWSGLKISLLKIARTKKTP